jgi:hypothetical protein
MPSHSPSKSTEQNDAPNPSLQQSLELIGKIIAPTTVLSALLYYFGWARTNALYGYFGLNQSVMGLSVKDYLLRGIVAAFEPLRWLLILGLAGIWLNYWIGHQMNRTLTSKQPFRFRLLVSVILGIGVLFLLAGPIIIFSRVQFEPLILPSTWMLGIMLTSYGAYLGLQLRCKREMEQGKESWATRVPDGLGQMSLGIVIGLLLFSLFWFVSMYAGVVGRWEGGQIATNLTDRPCVVIFSRVTLSIETDGTTVEHVSTQKDAYQYRYSGLRFLAYSAGNYFLLPANWSPDNARTIIIADTDTVRVEVAPGEFCSP